MTGGRDPATSQAYVDRRIPQIVASAPAEEAPDIETFLTLLYLDLGYLDRYFEKLFDTALGSGWTDAANLIWNGTVFRQTGSTAHPKYLEVAEADGYIELWEQRGAPDFCETVDEQWVCE